MYSCVIMSYILSKIIYKDALLVNSSYTNFGVGSKMVLFLLQRICKHAVVLDPLTFHLKPSSRQNLMLLKYLIICSTVNIVLQFYIPLP